MLDLTAPPAADCAGLLGAALPRLWPHADQHVPGLTAGIIAAARAVLAAHGITTPLVLAMMMGQFSEECGAGLEMTENLNYDAAGLARTWPAHFTGSMPSRYAHNPRMIADVAYGGRMGNALPPSDDGWTFRGRGLSQCTGRQGYAKLAAATGLDLLNHPDLVSDPAHALLCGVADFVLCGCLPFAARGDVVEVTRHLNGGTIGLAEREQWTARWRHELGAAAAGPAPAPARQADLQAVHVAASPAPHPAAHDQQQGGGSA
jgi:putative chitinase